MFTVMNMEELPAEFCWPSLAGFAHRFFPIWLHFSHPYLFLSFVTFIGIWSTLYILLVCFGSAAPRAGLERQTEVSRINSCTFP